MEEMRAAEVAGEATVVHCWGGGKRSGSMLAAWLVTAKGLTPEAAAEAIEASAEAQGSSRAADLQQVKELLGRT